MEGAADETKTCSQSAMVLHHSPRSGKTLVALASVVGPGLLPSKWVLLPHQEEALRLLAERGVISPAQQPRVSMMVFSSLAVVDQFRRDWLAGAEGGIQVLVACSLADGGGAGDMPIGLPHLSSSWRILLAR